MAGISDPALGARYCARVGADGPADHARPVGSGVSRGRRGARTVADATRAHCHSSSYSRNLLRRFDVVATRQPLFRKADESRDSACPASKCITAPAPGVRRTILRRAGPGQLRGAGTFLMFVQMLALAASAGGCASLRLNPDPEVAPSGNVARVWTPSRSISVANEAAPKLEELRTLRRATRHEPRRQIRPARASRPCPQDKSSNTACLVRGASRQCATRPIASRQLSENCGRRRGRLSQAADSVSGANTGHPQ